MGKAAGIQKCGNCNVTESPLWRKGGGGEILCNACGLYFKKHGASRPLGVARRRSRKKNPSRSRSGAGKASRSSRRAPSSRTRGDAGVGVGLGEDLSLSRRSRSSRRRRGDRRFARLGELVKGDDPLRMEERKFLTPRAARRKPTPTRLLTPSGFAPGAVAAATGDAAVGTTGEHSAGVEDVEPMTVSRYVKYEGVRFEIGDCITLFADVDGTAGREYYAVLRDFADMPSEALESGVGLTPRFFVNWLLPAPGVSLATVASFRPQHFVVGPPEPLPQSFGAVARHLQVKKHVPDDFVVASGEYKNHVPAFMSLNEALDERVPPRDLLNTFEVDDVHGVELLYSLTTAEPDDDQAIAAARAKAKAKAKAEARRRAAAAREEAQMADAVAS